jgi:hypothetical protein
MPSYDCLPASLRTEHIQSELVRAMYSEEGLEVLLKETDDVADKRCGVDSPLCFTGDATTDGLPSTLSQPCLYSVLRSLLPDALRRACTELRQVLTKAMDIVNEVSSRVIERCCTVSSLSSRSYRPVCGDLPFLATRDCCAGGWFHVFTRFATSTYSSNGHRDAIVMVAFDVLQVLYLNRSSVFPTTIRRRR